jgi:hypothetical protein
MAKAIKLKRHTPMPQRCQRRRQGDGEMEGREGMSAMTITQW